MIDLDYLLYGTPSWKEIVSFFEDDNWTGEEYLIQAIKKFLRTEEDRKQLFELDLSIEDILNCRYTQEQEEKVNSIYSRWNEKLGFKCFGH